MKKLFRLAAPVLALMATPSFAATLVDGSFEAQGADALSAPGAADYCYFNGGAGIPRVCGNQGEPFSGASGLITSGSAAWGSTPGQDGNYYSFVQSTGNLSQTFTASNTGAYALSWFDRQRSNNGGPQTYSVSLSAANIADVVLGTFTADNTAAWTSRAGAANFVLAAGTAYTLTFSGLTTGDNTAFIDNIAIAAVPELSTWGMMILGFGVVGAGMRRRRSAGKLAFA